MHQFGAFDAKNRLAELLDLVERGEEVVITRRGRRVARLVPDSGHQDRARAEAAAADILAQSRSVTLGGLGIKELIDEGRP